MSVLCNIVTSNYIKYISFRHPKFRKFQARFENFREINKIKFVSVK